MVLSGSAVFTHTKIVSRFKKINAHIHHHGLDSKSAPAQFLSGIVLYNSKDIILDNRLDFIKFLVLAELKKENKKQVDLAEESIDTWRYSEIL